MATTLLKALAYSRAPGNALSFWLRRHWRWSIGLPKLPHENKDGLFSHLQKTHTSREITELGRLATRIARTYRLDDLHAQSTQALYRKALYLLHCWDGVAGNEVIGNSDFPASNERSEAAPLRALDVGPQDWHYVFALERWLRYRSASGDFSGGEATGGLSPDRSVELIGIEVDGYERYRDLHTRQDYALAYAQQTGNSQVSYQIADIRNIECEPFDIVTCFFPLVTRYETLLWGLPASYCTPQVMAEKLARLTRPNGWLMLMTHTRREHDLARAYFMATNQFDCLRERSACNPLVDFHAQIQDRCISLWQRRL